MKTLLFLILAATALCAWCPWFESKQALGLINTQVTQINNTYPDVCPLTVDKTSLAKALFGYTINVSYDCAEVDTMGVAKAKNSVLITFYNGLIGMPRHVSISK